MRELPMLMNGHGVRATLAGTKVQTRRPVKPQPRCVLGAQRYNLNIGDIAMWHGWPHKVFPGEGAPIPLRNPLGAPGDLLYVRETHTWVTLAENEYDLGNPCHKRHPRGYPVVMIYRADGVEIASRWRPSIHMPKWAARLRVRNTGVRVECGPEISEANARAEGFESADAFKAWWVNQYPGLDWRFVTEYEVIER